MNHRSFRQKRRSYSLNKYHILFTILFACLFCYALVQRFTMQIRVQGISMEPTLSENDKLPLLRSQNPNIGDIIVFKEGLNGRNRFLVKRVIAGPGDTLRSDDGQLTKNNKPMAEPYLMIESRLQTGTWKVNGTQIGGDLAPLPENYYFVMGDNRANSTDSRVFGAITKSQIVGIVQTNK